MAQSSNKIQLSYIFEDELEHHGVKGMKWGQHIFGRNKKTDQDARDYSAKKSRSDIKKKIRHISDDDIERYIDRLTKEQKLRDLINKDLHPAMSFVKDVLTTNGNTVLSNFTKGSIAYLGKTLITRKPSVTDFVAYSFPNPNAKKK